MAKNNFVRKNFCCKAPQLNGIKPFVEKHEGNFSAAVGECIDFAIWAVERCGDLDRAKVLINSQQMCNDLRPEDEIVLKVVKVIRKK